MAQWVKVFPMRPEVLSAMPRSCGKAGHVAHASVIPVFLKRDGAETRESLEVHGPASLAYRAETFLKQEDGDDASSGPLTPT